MRSDGLDMTGGNESTGIHRPRRPIEGLRLLALTLLALGLLAGCSPEGASPLDEEEEPQYRRGQAMLRQGREDEALKAFLNVIDKRRDAPESHFQAAELYLGHIEDPVEAIHHYRRYLEVRPSSARAGIAEQRIETAMKHFARELPAEIFRSDLDRLDLNDLVEKQRSEINGLKEDLATAREDASRLRNEVAALRGKLEAMAQVIQGSALDPELSRRILNAEGRETRTPAAWVAPDTGSGGNESERQYEVVPGDTLSSISRKLYGESGRWMDIYQANRDQLSSPRDLRVGQILRIP